MKTDNGFLIWIKLLGPVLGVVSFIMAGLILGNVLPYFGTSDIFDYFMSGIMLPLGIIFGAFVARKILGTIALICICLIHIFLASEYYFHQSIKPMNYLRQTSDSFLQAFLMLTLVLEVINLAKHLREKRSIPKNL
jgi:hypothetical protein